MAWVRFNSISSQAGINVLLIEPLLHQIKVPADGLAGSPPSAMKGIISIHYFTLYNIPIINELQLWSFTRSIMAAAAGSINQRQKHVRGSCTRDELIIRFTTMKCHGSTDRTPGGVQRTSPQMFNIHTPVEKTRKEFEGRSVQCGGEHCRFTVWYFHFPIVQLLVTTLWNLLKVMCFSLRGMLEMIHQI